ncbi:hypothetical protein GCWU000325_00522 [Alloprevotella tannerae ATCC 51259]|uniref:Uncharacterized protein n=1 Tax=Alloprevotella tannerae ATCC 51259 TaxID=626522 RepID=C9LE96_9BACT|nr:hypothetical protein GCWU000325_00522 [Alloprevotella tannerae ATCC 51259]
MWAKWRGYYWAGSLLNTPHRQAGNGDRRRQPVAPLAPILASSCVAFFHAVRKREKRA